LVATRILDQKGGAELLDNGAGLTLYTGLRVNRHLALEAGWLGTLHNPERVQTAFGPDTDYLVMSGLTADAKVFVGNSTPNFEPFVQGGVGLYLVGRDSIGTESVGTGFQVGGGFIYRAGDHVELGIRALYRGMAMGPPEGLDNDTFVSALSMEGNLGFRF
jgi:hypothetical protein